MVQCRYMQNVLLKTEILYLFFVVGRSSIFSCSVVGEKHDMERFFSFKFSSVRIAIENAFGQLKGRFGCLKTSYGYWYQCITPSYYGLFRLTQL